MNQRILLIDDDSDACALLEATLSRLGYSSDSAYSAQEAIEALKTSRYGVVLTDLNMPGKSGLDLCEEVIAAAPGLPVIVVTADSNVESAIEAIRRGAFDYLTKPFDSQLLGLSVARALHRSRLHQDIARLKQQTESGRGVLLGDSATMRGVRDLITRLAASDASALIHGETGTGKELVARAIHNESARAKGPFIAINCAAVPANLLESELFGHAKGAFTDAKNQREGLFVKASGGTLFLDEIGDMPLEMQAKLLRALQERKVRPVGSNAEVSFDARIVAATHQDLEVAVKERRFREDLFYRINVVSINVPPLRERGGDILTMAASFLRTSCARADRPEVTLTAQVADRLLAHDWPGNVRELENCMERIAALARYESATLGDLPEYLRSAQQSPYSVGDSLSEEIVTIDELERRHIIAVLARANGNKTRAAELVGLDRRTLYRKLDLYQSRAAQGAANTSGSGAEQVTAG